MVQDRGCNAIYCCRGDVTPVAVIWLGDIAGFEPQAVGECGDRAEMGAFIPRRAQPAYTVSHTRSARSLHPLQYEFAFMLSLPYSKNIYVICGNTVVASPSVSIFMLALPGWTDNLGTCIWVLEHAPLLQGSS